MLEDEDQVIKNGEERQYQFSDVEPIGNWQSTACHGERSSH